MLAYKVDEALSKCKKELDKDEKNRIKTDLANLRRCLRKEKRAMALAADDTESLLAAMAAYRPEPVSKWLKEAQQL